MKPKNYFLCAILMMATMFALHAQVHYQIPAVGAIPGEINVSSMGTASYTIPIEVVPGTQGLEPNLSIVYNSSGGMGLLGMKWNLSGISAVTRCNRTPYHDDELAYFFFGNQDRFALNGERLVQISDGNYGWNGEEHATEVENYSRVISYGNHNPPYYYYYHFIEYNDDGTVAEYGNTSDSKQSVAIGEHFGFYIQKVTDADGNYMTYHYNNDKEKLIQEIHYTGNNNSRMETYAKVTFSYISNNINPNSYFVYKQYHIPQTKLLKTITVTGQNGFVRKYTFHYAHENVSGETTSHLTKIVLSGENDREIGATTITWGEPNDNPTNNVITLSNLPKGKTVTGDFNGDGYQDIIVYGQTGNIWKLYTHTPNTQNFVETTIQGTHCHLHDFDYYPSLPLKYHYKVSTCDFYSADVNGDGYDELVIVEKQPMLDINYFLFSHYSSICRIYSLKNGVTLLDTKTFSPFTELQQLVFGDFDGSGSTDIMYVKDKYTSPISFYSSSTNYTDTMLTAKGIPIGNATPMVPCYFNGDSRANVLINAGETWWENVFIDSYNQKLKKFMNFFSNSGARFDYLTPHIFPGDFNGDGTTDFLTFDTLKNWKVYTGGFYYKNNISLNISLENIASEYPNPKYLPIIADINGDGKDDIIQITPYQYNKTKVKIIYMKGWVPNNFITEVEEKIIDGNFVDKNYAVIDLYNDGFLDLLVYDTVAQKHKVICLHKNKEYNYVQKITDGLGKEIHLTYDFKYMDMEMVNANLSFYKKVFFPVVSSLKISNGLENNLNKREYQYQNLVYSASKRALMGFKNFEEKNVVENKTDSYIFAVDNSKHILKPVSKKTFYNSTCYNETDYNISFINFTKKRFMPYSSETTVKDLLNDTKTITTTSLYSSGDYKGRLQTSQTKTFNSVLENSYLHSKTDTYTYETITFDGYHKKTVPISTLSEQQYGNSSNTIKDTVTFGYYTEIPDKGRLHWMRQGNVNRSITTTFEEYTPAGLYQKATVSAAGCQPRTELYEYNDQQQFITKITNPLGHTLKYNYDQNGNKIKETDENGLITNYNYDTFGNLKKITNPDGTITESYLEWNDESYIPNAVYFTHTTSTGKPEVKIFYDMLNREVCRLEDGYYYDTRYNAKGQTEKTSFPYENIYVPDNNKDWNQYAYDSFGRITAEFAPYKALAYSYHDKMISVIDLLRYTSSYKIYDALGRITTAHDPGGTLTYTYTLPSNSSHQTKIVNNADGATTTIISDLWGNRTSITEPNAGTITSTYNNFNELIKQKNARGNPTIYQYDLLGRVIQKKFAKIDIKSREDAYEDPPRATQDTLIINYIYDNYNPIHRGKGKIYQIKINDSISETFQYDYLSRLSSYDKKIDDEEFHFGYSYNANGQLQNLVYPGGFTPRYSYTPVGKLKDIRRSDDNRLIYEVKKRNKYNQPTECNYGNNRINPICTKYTYNAYGLVTQIQTNVGIWSQPYERDTDIRSGLIMDYNYTYNNLGLMTSRADNVVNQQESFTYDNLDRLTKNTYYDYKGKKVTQTFDYASNGNITQNSQVGNYTYDSEKPHAVSQITEVNENLISENECDVTYNSFNQPTKIIDTLDTVNNTTLELYYGADQQRNKTVLKKNDTLISTRYYVSKLYEKEVTDTITKHYHYIYGDNGAVALHIFTTSNSDSTSGSGTDSMYYIHTDHLGSYCAITNEKGQVVQRNSFDPWGNYAFEKKYIMVLQDTIRQGDSLPDLSFPITNRGFTGHEHYPFFKIINMNGRLYDPVIGRFFSPDNFVQDFTSTQNYNRYSYALNNPLKYTDPSGKLTFKYNTGTQTHEKVQTTDSYSDDPWNHIIHFYDGDGGYLGSMELHCPASSINWNSVAGVGQTLASGSGCGTFGGGGGGGGGGFTYWDSSIGGHRDITKLPGYDPLRRTTVLDAVIVKASKTNPIQIDGSSARNGEGFHIPKIPINDKILKLLGYGSILLDGTKGYSKPLKKYVPFISIPINTASIYNSLADFGNEPSFEHGYRIANSIVGAMGFWGGMAAFTADMYESAFTWFINQTAELERQLQSNEFWFNLYGP